MGIIIPVTTQCPLDILITEGASVVWQSRSAPHLPKAPRDTPAVAGAVCPRHILPVCSACLQPFGAAGVFHACGTPACPWAGPRCGGSQKKGALGTLGSSSLSLKPPGIWVESLGCSSTELGDHPSSPGDALSIQGIYSSSTGQKSIKRTK